MKAVQRASVNVNLEHIIIDGGSTDGTQDIVRKNLRSVDTIISEPDNGISDAFNKGCKISKGLYLHIMNSDDWIEQNFYEILLNASNNGEAPFVHSDAQWWLNEKKYLYAFGKDEYFEEIKTRFRMKYIQHGSMIIRRDIFKEVGKYDINLKSAMDLDWLVRATNKNIRGVSVSGAIINFSIGGQSFGNQTIHDAYQIRYKHGVPKWKCEYEKVLSYLRIFFYRVRSALNF